MTSCKITLGFPRLNILQSPHEVYKAGKLTTYLRKFHVLPAVLVVLFSCDTFVRSLITSCLERWCGEISKQLHTQTRYRKATKNICEPVET